MRIIFYLNKEFVRLNKEKDDAASVQYSKTVTKQIEVVKGVMAEIARLTEEDS